MLCSPKSESSSTRHCIVSQFLRALSFKSMRVRQVALPGSQKGLHKWTVQLLIKITSDFEEPAPNTPPFLLRDKILIFSKL